MREPIVYLIHNQGMSYDAAEEFGETVTIFRGFQKKYRVDFITQKLIAAFADSQPDDMIVITGVPLINCIACSVFTAMHSRLNLLLYLKRENKYSRHEILL